VGSLHVAHYVWFTSLQFVAESLVSAQLPPKWRSPSVALVQYAMGCMLGALGEAFSRRGELGWVHPFFNA
jgi:hypothetical protein